MTWEEGCKSETKMLSDWSKTAFILSENNYQTVQRSDQTMLSDKSYKLSDWTKT